MGADPNAVDYNTVVNPRRSRRNREEGGSPQPTPDSGTTPIIPTSPIQPNIFLPPGVDPYYGLTISNLSGSASTGGSGGGGSNPPPDEQDYSGSKQDGDLFPSGRPGGRGSGAEQEDYLNYVYGGGTLGYDDWRLLTKNNNTSSSKNTGTSIYSGPFQIATPNMTWANSLPTVMPAGGGTSAAQYGPMPFTREANTPGITYNPPPLTYNNPYNTNPYLPTSNPFALVPNNTGTAQ